MGGWTLIAKMIAVGLSAFFLSPLLFLPLSIWAYKKVKDKALSLLFFLLGMVPLIIYLYLTLTH